MNPQLFSTYRDCIKKWIESCIITEQLVVCCDVIDRFTEQFKSSIPAGELSQATDELNTIYLQKQHELHIY